MSTKIYNGYKINTTSLKKLHKFSLDFKEQCRQLCEEAANKYYVEGCIMRKTRLELGLSQPKEGDKDSIHWHVFSRIQEMQREIKKKGVRYPEVDFDISWVFIPVKNYTLALLYSERREITDLWESQDIIEEYGYWDNVDPDEDCSEQEWKQRERDWSILGYDAPSTCGFSFSVYGDYDMPPKFFTREDLTPEFYAKYYDRESFKKYLIYELVYGEAFKDRDDDVKFLLKDDLKEWSKNNPVKRKEIENRVDKTLKESYSFRDFTNETNV
jgi:hypothetical protein